MGTFSLFLLMMPFFDPNGWWSAVALYSPFIIFLLACCFAPVKYLFAPVVSTVALNMLTNPNLYISTVVLDYGWLTVFKVLDAVIFLILTGITLFCCFSYKSIHGSLLDYMIRLVKRYLGF